MSQPADFAPDRIHRLAIRQLEGLLTDDERAELIDVLKGSAEARRVYLAHMQDTVSLRWMFSGHCDRRAALRIAEHGPQELRNGHRGRLAWGGLAVAASLACLVALLPWGQDRQTVGDAATAAGPGPAVDAAEAPAAIATVRSMSGVAWAKGAVPAGMLSGVTVGQEFNFVKGTLELTFLSGAEVKVFGPAKFKISSPKSILCARGRVTTRVGKSGKGFTIDTPKARIVDLGTEFGVDISAKGETQVVVFKGSVDLTQPVGASSPEASGAEQWTRRLQQGDGLVVDDSGEAQRLMAVRRGDFFPQSNRDAYGRPYPAPVILDVSDHIRDGESTKCYQIVRGGLREDAPSFVDRSHQWNGCDGAGIPDFLLGADYIMPFNDDKFLSGLTVDVTVARPATCYVFLDDNMPAPDWLRKEFRDTGLNIGLDGAKTVWHKDHATESGAGNSIDFPFSIWARDVAKAGVVRLGGVEPPQGGVRSRGFNMYGIAVVPK